MDDIFTKDNFLTSISESKNIAEKNNLPEVAKIFSEFIEESNFINKKIEFDDKDSKILDDAIDKANDIANDISNATNSNDIARLRAKAEKFISSLPPSIAARISSIVELAITQSSIKTQNIALNSADYRENDREISQQREERINKALYSVKDSLDKLSKDNDITHEDFSKIKEKVKDKEIRKDIEKSNEENHDRLKELHEKKDKTAEEYEEHQKLKKNYHLETIAMIADRTKEHKLDDHCAARITNYLIKNIEFKDNIHETRADSGEKVDNRIKEIKIERENIKDNQKLKNILDNSDIDLKVLSRVTNIGKADQSENKSASQAISIHEKKSGKETHVK